MRLHDFLCGGKEIGVVCEDFDFTSNILRVKRLGRHAKNCTGLFEQGRGEGGCHVLLLAFPT